LGVLDPAARLLQLNTFFATSILVETYTTAILGPIKKDPIYCERSRR
jgi:hypothetical protein